MDPFEAPRLIADIGGTYARLALETAPGQLAHAQTLRCDAHPDFPSAVAAFLQTVPAQRIVQAAVAIAYPVEGDAVRMTNAPWAFSIEAVRQQLGLDTLLVVNDFTALAMALPRLGPDGSRQVGGGQARDRSVIGLLGAGSGLGTSGLIPAGEGWVSLGAEGGHTSFAPRDDRELAVLQYAWQRFHHVSFERLLSGPGLSLIHAALAQRAGAGADTAELPAPEITRLALAAEDPLAIEALDLFCAMLGTAASDLAVTLGAAGGIYIGGGIVPRLGSWFDRSRFRQRFEDKGRFSRYVAAIPTRVIVDEQATLTGAAAILASQIPTRPATTSGGILAQIRRAHESLSPAERRVADHVLGQPRDLLIQPIADIARAAAVSQPTVIRFCRSLGCQGLSDFKLRLASGLTGTLPIRHVQVTDRDSTVELGAKVLGNTASALLDARSGLSPDMIRRSIQLLARASRVECCAMGQYGAMAQDAQYKLLRIGIPAGATTDPRMQLLAVNLLKPGDVVLIISASGRSPELLEVADRARARGAKVLAITTGQSPLARKAHTLLTVDHVEDPVTQVPMIGRVLQLLMVDILTVGLAMQRAADPTLQPSDGGPANAPRAAAAAADHTPSHLTWPSR